MATVDAVGGGTQQSTADMVKKILGKDDFLKLLITQLKYQDPLEPTDNKDFIAQMAQFSSLEQMANMSSGLEKLAGTQELMLREYLVAQAVNMIGHTVSAVVPMDRVDSTPNLVGVVTGMKIIDGVPNLLVNGREIPLSLVEEVNMTVPAGDAENSA